MLTTAFRSQFQHIAKQYDFVRKVFHLVEIGQSGFHACRVGVVSIDNQPVMLRLCQLRAVVLRNVFADGLANGFGCNAKVVADANGCKNVFEVITADEVCSGFVRNVVQLPFDTYERVAFANLSAYVCRGVACGIGVLLQSCGNLVEVSVVFVDKNFATVFA